MSIIGYKVFNPDWTCRGFKYEVGKTYKHNGNIEMCGAGFHFCQKISDCFNYYNFDSKNKVAKVEAIGLVETRGDKSVTDEIVILEELSWNEMLKLANEGRDNNGLGNTGDYNTGDWNTGDWNTGDYNTGHCNTGHRNTGDWNTGDYNTGHRNTGDYNTGHRNTGDYNTGHRNTGHRNTGHRNTGHRNTGDWNLSDFNTGFFTTKSSNIQMFNKLTEFSEQSNIRELKGMKVLGWNYENSWWIYSDNMTEEEKQQHPEYKTTGGYLKTVDHKTACKIMWKNLDNDDKRAILDLPNFDKEVFKEITGIDIDMD